MEKTHIMTKNRLYHEAVEALIDLQDDIAPEHPAVLNYNIEEGKIAFELECNIRTPYEKFIVQLPAGLKTLLDGDERCFVYEIFSFLDNYYDKLNFDNYDGLILIFFRKMVKFFTDEIQFEDYYEINSHTFLPFLLAIIGSKYWYEVATEWINNAKKTNSIESAVWFCEIARYIKYHENDLKNNTGSVTLHDKDEKKLLDPILLKAKMDKIVVETKKGLVPKKYTELLIEELRKP